MEVDPRGESGGREEGEEGEREEGEEGERKRERGTVGVKMFKREGTLGNTFNSTV